LAQELPTAQEVELPIPRTLPSTAPALLPRAGSAEMEVGTGPKSYSPLTLLEETWPGQDPEKATAAEPSGNTRRRLLTGKAAALVAGALGLAAVATFLARGASSPSRVATTSADGVVSLQAVPAPSGLQNSGRDCWAPCSSTPGLCSWCGEGNACCRYGATQDPEVCSDVQIWGAYSFHTCVALSSAPAEVPAPFPAPAPVASGAVKNSGADCWTPCKGFTGFCPFCGSGACCRYGSTKDPAECHTVSKWPTTLHHTCVDVDLTPPGPPLLGPVPMVAACVPGEELGTDGDCKPANSPALMEFYMYRSKNDDNYHAENVNMASLTGAMWYLQNEVIFTCPRKFGLTRLVRYLVTMKNTQPLFKAPLHYQFGQFVQFDSGECTWNRSHCEELWKQYGYIVGCQPLDVTNPMLPNYAGPPAPVWYSLPGTCPSKAFNAKTQACSEAEPGGECFHPDGSANCTWSAKYAGEVRLDELSGIANYTDFCANGGREYDKVTDKGVGVDFWDDRRDQTAARERISKVQQAFQQKYPSWPATLGEPPCDWYR